VIDDDDIEKDEPAPPVQPFAPPRNLDEIVFRKMILLFRRPRRQKRIFLHSINVRPEGSSLK